MTRSLAAGAAVIFLLIPLQATAADPAECNFWVNNTGSTFVAGSCSGPKQPGFEEQRWEKNCTSDCGGGGTGQPFKLRLNGSCAPDCTSHCQWEWGPIFYNDYTFDVTGFDGEHEPGCMFGCKDQGQLRSESENCYPGQCGHACWEPLIVSLRDDEYRLTDATDGVSFDLTADGVPEQIPWTAAGSDDAFVVLDRNRNGVIDDGRELFSHVSPQPPALPGELYHGFRALAIFDEAINGGDGDGWITAADKIFGHLRMWHDKDHDGETDLGELLTLDIAGLNAISLEYTDAAQYFDRYGNDFHFSAKASFNTRSIAAWAVFFAAPGTDENEKRVHTYGSPQAASCNGRLPSLGLAADVLRQRVGE